MTYTLLPKWFHMMLLFLVLLFPASGISVTLLYCLRYDKGPYFLLIPLYSCIAVVILADCNLSIVALKVRFLDLPLVSA